MNVDERYVRRKFKWLEGYTITKELARYLVIQVDNLVLNHFFVVVVKRKVSRQ